MSNLYRNAAEHKVENGITFTEEVIVQTLHAIYDQQIDTHKQIDAQLFDQIHKVFDRAISVGVKEQPVDNSFLQELKTNNGVFAAFKTHRMQNDMAHQLLDDEGKLKSFQQFRSDVQDIVSHHRDAWLRTEYDTAIKRARKAAQMRQFINERDVLPNLRWLPSTALNPREEHIPFYDHVWPMDSPFWDDHQPGDAWGCQCDWEATDDPVTDNTGLDAPSILPDKGLRGNPAKSGHLFSQDHPYFPDSCSLCPFNTSQLSIFSNKIKDCYNCHNVQKAIVKAAKSTEQIAKTKYWARTQISKKLISPLVVCGADYKYGKVVCSKADIRNLIFHAQDAESIRVALRIDEYLQRLVYINTEKPVHLTPKKVNRGLLEYVVYQLSIGQDVYVVKCEARDNTGKGNIKEYPYSIYKK